MKIATTATRLACFWDAVGANRHAFIRWVLVSPNCVFDASLVPETCLEFSTLPVWSGIRFGKLRPIYDMALRARRLAWLWYWRSLVWWQGPSCKRPFDPVGEFFKPFVTGPNRILISHRGEQR
jgi:hypothetical protein